MPNAWDDVSALLLSRLVSRHSDIIGGDSVCDGSTGRSTRRDSRGSLGKAVLIGTLIGLPVNGDFEDGYGTSPAMSLRRSRRHCAGLAGIGMSTTGILPNRSAGRRSARTGFAQVCEGREGADSADGPHGHVNPRPSGPRKHDQAACRVRRRGRRRFRCPLSHRHGCGQGDCEGRGAQAGQPRCRHDARYAAVGRASEGRRQARQSGRGPLHSGDGRLAEGRWHGPSAISRRRRSASSSARSRK